MDTSTVGGIGIPVVTVGGNPCRGGVDVISEYEVVCLDVSAELWQSDTVHVVVDGQQVRTAGLFRAVRRPSVSRLEPQSGPTAGNWTVRVFGTGFGDGIDDLGAITINGRACRNVTFISSSQLECQVPAGMGRSLDVVVYNVVGGASQPVPLLSYDSPVISCASPEYSLTAPVGAAFVDV